jgi:hypothetical protein
LGGHQLGRRRTPELRQPGARYVLSSTVPRYGYSSRSMNSCTILDPLGAQAVRQPGHLQDGVVKMFCVSLLAIFLNFTCFFCCCAILILSCTQNHFRLAKEVSLQTANIVFDNAASKVIKGVIKHAHLVSTVSYYSQVLYHSL